MIADLTTADVEIGAAAADWEEAIAVAASPLLESGDIERSYVEAMIDAIHRVGPYVVLCPGVALAHARPECGVNRSALHFTTFSQGVPFGKKEFDPIRLVITLAATDDSGHIGALSELAGILMDSSNVDALVACTDKGEFLERLRVFAEQL